MFKKKRTLSRDSIIIVICTLLQTQNIKIQGLLIKILLVTQHKKDQKTKKYHKKLWIT